MDLDKCKSIFLGEISCLKSRSLSRALLTNKRYGAGAFGILYDLIDLALEFSRQHPEVTTLANRCELQALLLRSHMFPFACG